MRTAPFRPNQLAIGAILVLLVGLLLFFMSNATPDRLRRGTTPSGWKAGVARKVITPEGPIWMSGYASRTRPSEGVRHDLWAKALVLEGSGGGLAVLVTLDLVGIDRTLSVEVRDDLNRRYGLDRARVTLACSHTHTGPVVRGNLVPIYDLDDAQKAKVNAYAKFLREAIVEVVGEAIEAVVPADLAWETGQVGFAVNRRNNKEDDVEDLRTRLALAGPTDHDVPVLRVVLPDDELLAVVFGYACHGTVLGDYLISGDYAGYAQLALERAHPGAQAMFVAGCGGDQNPLPRRTVERAEAYGDRLAEAVERVLDGSMRPIEGKLSLHYQELSLPFATLPTREQLESEVGSSNRGLARRASYLLGRIKSEGKLPATHPYPIQVWKLGDGPAWIFLGGEVVVDYALRLKRNLGPDRTWVSAYCNDVMAYVPSKRVLEEGGYEGSTSMIAYGQPTVWADTIEESIVGVVERLCRGLGYVPEPVP